MEAESLETGAYFSGASSSIQTLACKHDVQHVILRTKEIIFFDNDNEIFLETENNVK